MRFMLFIVALMVLAAVPPAMAGTVNFVDGRGSWQPSGCALPQAPSSLSSNPEAAANDLNAGWAMHNQYAEAAQAYMNCVSAEAQRDGSATAQMISQTAQNLISQMQASVESSAANLRAGKQAVVTTP